MSRYETLRRNEHTVLRRTRKFLRENKFIISEKSKSKSKLPTTNPIAMAWDTFAKTATSKTTVFETMPLIFAMTDTPPDKITMSEIREILNMPKDWDKTAKDWLIGIFDALIEDDDLTDAQSEKLFKSFMQNVVYGQGESKQSPIITHGGASLKDLNGGKKISDFIHGNIKGKGGFYRLLTHVEGGKQFTADTILFWGDPNAANKILSGEIEIKEMKREGDLLVTSDGKIKMACVSLKAFIGKIGKITKYIVHQYGDGSMSIDVDDDDMSEQLETESLNLNEGVGDLIKKSWENAKNWIRNTKIVKLIKGWYDDFISWSSGIVNKLLSFEDSDLKTKGQAEYDRLSKQANELLEEFDKQLEEQIKRNGMMTEDKSNEKLVITDCYYEKIKSWYQLFDNDVKKFNQVFTDFAKEVSEYQTHPLFRVQFESLNTRAIEYGNWTKNVRKLIDQDLKKLKPGDKVSGKSSCKLLLQGNEVFRLSRAELKPLLMSNANFCSIELLKNMIEDCKKTVFNQKKAKDALFNLVKFSTKLNAEAVFGGVIDIPLVKYNGTKIESLGTRTEYEDNTAIKLSGALIKNTDIPIVGIKIFPAKLEKQGDPFPTWYTVLMYTLADMDEKVEEGKDDTRSIKEKLIYNEIRYSCNSGSKFSFASEGIKRISGADLERYLKSETIPS